MEAKIASRIVNINYFNQTSLPCICRVIALAPMLDFLRRHYHKDISTTNILPVAAQSVLGPAAVHRTLVQRQFWCLLLLRAQGRF
jgi:hypothetical protein